MAVQELTDQYLPPRLGAESIGTVPIMRIIAGTAGGRRIKAPDTKNTRPVTDRAREGVFSMIGDWVVGAGVADLYAGSGSFGLEALSRGAASATFVENGPVALAALRHNVESLELGGTVAAVAVRRFLETSSDRFDLVFIDPPWDLDRRELEIDLNLLDQLIDEKAEVVVSRRHTDQVPEPPKRWRVATERRYGDTRILRYEKL